MRRVGCPWRASLQTAGRRHADYASPSRAFRLGVPHITTSGGDSAHPRPQTTGSAGVPPASSRGKPESGATPENRDGDNDDDKGRRTRRRPGIPSRDSGHAQTQWPWPFLERRLLSVLSAARKPRTERSERSRDSRASPNRAAVLISESRDSRNRRRPSSGPFEDSSKPGGRSTSRWSAGCRRMS